jgi:hypothetical protein
MITYDAAPKVIRRSLHSASGCAQLCDWEDGGFTSAQCGVEKAQALLEDGADAIFGVGG